MKNFMDYMYDQMENNFTRWDYGFLKFYGFLFGLILGAHFPAFVKSNLVIIVSIFLILLVRYSYLMFFKKSGAEKGEMTS